MSIQSQAVRVSCGAEKVQDAPGWLASIEVWNATLNHRQVFVSEDVFSTEAEARRVSRAMHPNIVRLLEKTWKEAGGTGMVALPLSEQGEGE